MHIESSNSVFVIKKCLYWKQDIGNEEGYIIEGPYPCFYPNLFLHRLKPTTARQYGYKLVKWLNYCLINGYTYIQANEKTLNHFLNNLLFDNENGILSFETLTSKSTITSYVSVITDFYVLLQSLRDDIQMPLFEEKVPIHQDAYLKDIVWSKTKKKLFVDKYIERYKAKKEYIKWYTEEEKEALLSNMKSFRDKAVFLVLLDGARIDEVLSTHIYDLHLREKYITAYRSKGKDTGDTGRVIALSSDTVKVIENYMLYERNEVELDLLGNDSYISDYLFVNTKNGDYYGHKMQYANYLKILKNAAKRAGIDPKTIRTHSGRSSSVMKDIIFHALHPDLMSLEDIRLKYGWSNISSMYPYIDTSNPLIALENRKYLDKVREELKDKYNISELHSYNEDI